MEITNRIITLDVKQANMEKTRGILRYTACPLCSSENINEELTTRDYLESQEKFSLWRCTNCSFLFTQAVPDEENIGRYYASEDYVSHSDTQEGFINKAYHTVREMMLSKKWRLLKKLGNGKKVLDVGCGTGYFLNFLKQKSFDIHGVEVDEGARSIAQKNFGIHINTPDYLFSDKIDKDFDYITMWHVLEHIHDLKNNLLRFHELLRPTGKLIIAVPNHESFEAKYYMENWAGFDVPRHLWHFSPDTLERAAEESGFKIKKIHRLPFDPFYNALLSEGYRKNKLKFISAPIIGGLSYLNSLVNVKKSSSPIYILEK